MKVKPNCRPGEIAIVIRAEQSNNLGAIVEVLRLCDRTGELRYPDDMLVWIVRCSRYQKWVYRGKNYYRKEGPVPDAVLRPIRGDGSQTLMETLESLPELKEMAT